MGSEWSIWTCKGLPGHRLFYSEIAHSNNKSTTIDLFAIVIRDLHRLHAFAICMCYTGCDLDVGIAS